MGKVPIKEIQGKSKDELISDLRARRYSLLDSVNCKRLRLEMLPLGIVARIIVNRLYAKSKRESGEKWAETAKKRLVKLLEWGAPYEFGLNNSRPMNTGGLVIGFNHPSLGEIIRLISFVSDEYPENKYLFPVSLIWYEALCPVIDKMEAAGFYLTPIVTPTVKQKISKFAKKDELDLISVIGQSFNTVYMNLCREFVKNKDIIILAPSATRQKYIFKTDAMFAREEKVEPQTMSLLMTALRKDAKDSDLKLLPITIVPPKESDNGLNLFQVYRFGAGEMFSFSKAFELSKAKYGEFLGRELDYEFLARISKIAFYMGRYDMIAPFEKEDSLNPLARILDFSG